MLFLRIQEIVLEETLVEIEMNAPGLPGSDNGSKLIKFVS
jgi:hypothetical protein